MLLGVQVGVIAIIARAVHRIGEHVLVDRWLWLVAALAAIATLLGVPFWISLPMAGLAHALLAAGRAMAGVVALAVGAVLAASLVPSGPDMGTVTRHTAMVAARSVGAVALFVTGLKAGLLTFGGAYTAIPFVRDDAVGHGWVSDGQFLDSLALSGMIPAPLIIFATFVGYQAGGLAGALAITAGIFLPAFAFSLLFFDRLEQVIEDQRVHRFLEGVAAGVVGLIAITTLELGYGVASSLPSVAIAGFIFVASLATLYLWKSRLNLVVVVLGSAVAGLLLGAGGQ
jgi:chromate transporter